MVLVSMVTVTMVTIYGNPKGGSGGVPPPAQL